MNRVFGRKKAPGKPAPSLHDASSGVGTHMDSMDVKITSLDKELKGYRDKLKTTRNPGAKKNLQKRAMDVLKRKRMYESQRDQLAGQQFNIDQASFGIESAKASVAMVSAMKAASGELKATIRNDLNIDDVDDLADDMGELMDEFQEINEVKEPWFFERGAGGQLLHAGSHRRGRPGGRAGDAGGRVRGRAGGLGRRAELLAGVANGDAAHAHGRAGGQASGGGGGRGRRAKGGRVRVTCIDVTRSIVLKDGAGFWDCPVKDSY